VKLVGEDQAQILILFVLMVSLLSLRYEINARLTPRMDSHW